MTDDKEPRGLSDEEMDKLKKDIGDLLEAIDWDRIAEEEEEEEEEEDKSN